MKKYFSGRTAVITGGATGIGAATAKLLAELGTRVAIFDRNTKDGAATAAAIRDSGGNALCVECDVASETAVQRGFERTEKELGTVSLLVHSAGIQRYGKVGETSEQTWQETMGVHVNGCFYAARAAVQQMLRAGGGSIVVVGSVQTMTAASNSAAYVTAKHALLGLVRSIALDYATENIRANCVLPGAIDTPLLRWCAEQSPDPKAVLAATARMHAMRRLGHAEEVAKAIVFLLSDWASFITGAPLLVDGGMLVPTGGMGFAEGGTGAALK